MCPDAPPPAPDPVARRKARNAGMIALTFALAIAGTVLFWWQKLPLPFLFGPMSACLIAALCGLRLRGIPQLSMSARTVVGVTVGASITPEVAGQLPQMMGSVAFVPFFIIAVGLIGVPYFTRICGYDRMTAYFAAMPGSLQDMIIFGQEAGANVRTLSLIHATRVLVIVVVAPIVMVQVFGVSLDRPLGAAALDIPWTELVLMAAAALIGWKGGERIGLFGASVIGPLILAGALSLTGLIEHRPPKEAIMFAQFFIGMWIGVGYVGVTLAELRRDIVAGVVFMLILAGLTFAFAEIVVQAGFAEPVEGFLSFAPGGQTEMAVLAIVAGADLGFVVVHHVTRVVLVIIGAPFFVRFLAGKKRR